MSAFTERLEDEEMTAECPRLLKGSLVIFVIFSIVSAILSLSAAVTDDVIVVQVGSTIVDQVSDQILLPQLDFTLGLVRTCFGGRCPAKTGMTGPISLIPSTSPLAGDAENAYADIKQFFYGGYDMSGSCGARVARIRSISILSLAGVCIAFVFFLALVVLSALLFVTHTRMDVFKGTPYVDESKLEVLLHPTEMKARYVLQEINAHLSLERRVLIAILVCSIFAFIFSLIPFACMVNLVLAQWHCGSPYCSSLRKSFDNFIDALREGGNIPGGGHNLSCRNGPTFAFIVTTFALSACLCVLAVLMFLIYECGSYERKLRFRQKILRRTVGDLYSLKLALEADVRTGHDTSRRISRRASMAREASLGASPEQTDAEFTDASLAQPPEHDGPPRLGDAIKLIQRRKSLQQRESRELYDADGMSPARSDSVMKETSEL